MKQKFATLLIGLLLLVLPSWSESHVWKASELVDPFTIDSTHYILDDLGYLSDSAKASLNALCADFNHKADLELAIVLLDKIDDDPFEFGQRLYNQWGLGRNGRGLLLTILTENRGWQFNTGTGAEGIFPDGLLYQVGTRKLVPNFRKGNYAKGIRDALDELYDIAQTEDRDDFFESNGYDRSNFASMHHPTSSDYEAGSEEEISWNDITYSLFFVVLFLIGIISSSFAYTRDNVKTMSEKYQATIDEKDNRAYFAYDDEQKSNVNIGAWADHGCLRYLLIDGGVFIVCVISAIRENSFLFVVIGIFVYLTYWALCWGLMIYWNLKKLGDNDIAKFVSCKLFSQTNSLNTFKIVTPWIGFPIAYWLSAQAKKYGRANIVSCPICQEKAVIDAKQEYQPDSQAENFEKENNVIERITASCHQGHRIILSIPSKEYNQYRVCPQCHARAATKTGSKTLVKPSNTHKGERINYYTCQCCNNIETVTVSIPMLTNSSSGSTSSGGYREGGSHGSW